MNPIQPPSFLTTSQITKSKDVELWEAYKKNPNQMTLQPLMKQLDPLLQNEVNKWAGAIGRPVLETRAKVLTLEAIKSYNPNGGAALATHVVNRLQKLSREVYTHQDAIRVPEYKKLKVQNYMRAERELMDEHGREPTQLELTEHLGWSPPMVSQVQRSISSEYVESQDTGAGMFETTSAWGSDAIDGMVDLLYYDLDPTDKLIFEHATGYSGKKILNNTQMTKQTGLSQGQLSYRKRKIIDQFSTVLK